MTQGKGKIVELVFLLAAAAICNFALTRVLNRNNVVVTLAEIVLIIVIGAGFVLKRTADIIEETTDVLSHRTKTSSGVLQSIGTAFPDMSLGIMAAVLSLNLASSDLSRSINYAIIA